MRKFVALAFVAMVMVLPGRALAVTPEEQAACTDDAFRLCEQFIPDEQRVKACLIKNMRRLSKPCRQVFARGKRSK